MARYFVAPGATGNASSWGNEGDLIATVNRIINNPSPQHDDEIWALRGDYDLARTPLSINNNVAPLSIYGGFAGGENTLCERNAKIDSSNPIFFQSPSVLDGGGVNVVIEMQNANVCRIDGFVVQNGNSAANPDGGGVFVRDSYTIWFENMVFMDNIAGRCGGGMYAETMFSLMIKNTIFFNNRAIEGGGLYVGNGDNTLLVNLLFNENQTVDGEGNAIHIIGNWGVKIINNTISGNMGGSSGVYCAPPPSPLGTGVDIYNSIIYPDTLVVVGGTALNPVARVYYCCLANLLPPNIQVSNNLITNPLFINPAPLSSGGDYHLQPSSPCIDAGNTNLIFPFSATDLEGKPRFVDGGNLSFPMMQVDMGAFEVQ